MLISLIYYKICYSIRQITSILPNDRGFTDSDLMTIATTVNLLTIGYC